MSEYVELIIQTREEHTIKTIIPGRRRCKTAPSLVGREAQLQLMDRHQRSFTLPKGTTETLPAGEGVAAGEGGRGGGFHFIKKFKSGKSHWTSYEGTPPTG